MGMTAFQQDGHLGESWQDLVGPDGSGRRFAVVGGKGGVGKTSTSAALGIACAEQGGHNTVVVSTDPAHSLGDALGLDLRPGKLTAISEVPLFGEGCLYALEVDVAGAVEDFKEAIRGFAAAQEGNGGTTSAVLEQLNIQDFADVLDTAPPGLDELVALAKVITLLNQGKGGASGSGGAAVQFDRIIIDTAPTGHTLRLLSLPSFLDDFLERLIALRKKLSGATAMLSMFTGSGGGGAGSGQGDGANFEEQRDRLRDLQVQMFALEDLLKDQDQTQFIIVTIPTELAMAESERLVQALQQDQEIAVRNLIINQVLTDDQVAASYIQGIASVQKRCLHDLESAVHGGSIAVTKVPWLDVETTSVFGLRVLGTLLLRDESEAGASN